MTEPEEVLFLVGGGRRDLGLMCALGLFGKEGTVWRAGASMSSNLLGSRSDSAKLAASSTPLVSTTRVAVECYNTIPTVVSVAILEPCLGVAMYLLGGIDGCYGERSM
jgi:hypothetical protein